MNLQNNSINSQCFGVLVYISLTALQLFNQYCFPLVFLYIFIWKFTWRWEIFYFSMDLFGLICFSLHKIPHWLSDAKIQALGGCTICCKTCFVLGVFFLVVVFFSPFCFFSSPFFLCVCVTENSSDFVFVVQLMSQNKLGTIQIVLLVEKSISSFLQTLNCSRFRNNM